MTIRTVRKTGLVVMSVIMMLLTGCATQSSQVTPVGLEAIIDSSEMIWLGQNLDEEEWTYLSSWLKNKLTPYVVRLEVKEP